MALLIDDRRSEVDNLTVATALSALGEARELSGPDRDAWERALLEAHPSLASFVRLPDCALFCVEVSRYLLVSQFERVVELRRPGGVPGPVPKQSIAPARPIFLSRAIPTRRRSCRGRHSGPPLARGASGCW